MLKIKRVYEKPVPADGERILVDRLWPRGISKKKAKIDVWLTDIAPSAELRKWFGHDPEKWGSFAEKYAYELMTKKELLSDIRARSKKKTITLVYGARDSERNHAIVLARVLKRHA